MKARKFFPLLVIVAGLLAYHNCFVVPFLLDDADSISGNRTIRYLWPVWDALSPPHGRGSTVEGRPALNFSFAVNYALNGNAPWGYHALNLAIHILAGLTLYGIVRRTLLRTNISAQFGSEAAALALAIAVIWTVHPLQTEAVTYVAQRAESLMGLFYLLTLYCFIRGTESEMAGIWYVLSVTACLLGMGSKEVMVSAPLMVLLYDRTFVVGNIRDAWKQRWHLYVGLASTWILLAYLVANTRNRGGSAGFETDVAWWPYALTQCRAVIHYLKLSMWPYPLVFDYGTASVKHVGEIAPYALVLAALATGTIIALWRGRAIGFLGAWFFAILAPSSSVVPVATQTIAEHRMYLPLAAVVVLVALGIHALVGRRSIVVFFALAMGLCLMTSRRNEDYRSDLAIWTDTSEKLPSNVRARVSLGLALFRAGRVPEAIRQYEQALQINPTYEEAHLNLGLALQQVGRGQEAIEQYKQASQIDPHDGGALNDWGTALEDQARTRSGMPADALFQQAGQKYEQALCINPDMSEAWNNWGAALVGQAKTRSGMEANGLLQQAAEKYKQAVRINPDYMEAHLNLGSVLVDLDKPGEAIRHYEEALRIQPNYWVTHLKLANALLQAGQIEDAVAQYRQALQIAPQSAETRYHLGIALERAGRVGEAIKQYELALKIRPDLSLACDALDRLDVRPKTNGSSRNRDDP